MFVEELRHKIGSFLNFLLLNGKDQEIESLKRQIEVLKQGLSGGHANSVNALRHEIETLRTDLEGWGDSDRAILRQEIEILRNELLENITAIHRLEVLTLAERNELLKDFGKALPPTRLTFRAII